MADYTLYEQMVRMGRVPPGMGGYPPAMLEQAMREISAENRGPNIWNQGIKPKLKQDVKDAVTKRTANPMLKSNIPILNNMGINTLSPQPIVNPPTPPIVTDSGTEILQPIATDTANDQPAGEDGQQAEQAPETPYSGDTTMADFFSAINKQQQAEQLRQQIQSSKIFPPTAPPPSVVQQLIPETPYTNAYSGVQGMTLQSAADYAQDKVQEMINPNPAPGVENRAEYGATHITPEEAARVENEINQANESMTNYTRDYNNAINARVEQYKTAQGIYDAYQKATDPLAYGDTSPIYDTGVYVRNPATGTPMLNILRPSYQPVSAPPIQNYDKKVEPPRTQSVSVSAAYGKQRPNPVSSTGPKTNTVGVIQYTAFDPNNPLVGQNRNIRTLDGMPGDEPASLASTTAGLGKNYIAQNLAQVVPQILANGTAANTGLFPYKAGWDNNGQYIHRQGNMMSWFHDTLSFLYQWGAPDPFRKNADGSNWKGIGEAELRKYAGINNSSLQKYIGNLYAAARTGNTTKAEIVDGKIVAKPLYPWDIEPPNSYNKPNKIGINSDYFMTGQYDANGNPMIDVQKLQQFMMNDPLMQATINAMKAANEQDLQFNPAAEARHGKAGLMEALMGLIKASAFWE